MSEHTNNLKGTEDFDATDKFELIAEETDEAYETMDEGLDGKSDTMDSVLPTLQTKNTYSKDEQSVSSGKGGEEKLEQSLDEDNVVKGLPNNEPNNLKTQSLEPSLTEASKEVKINSVDGLADNKANNCVTQSQQPIENAANMAVEANKAADGGLDGKSNTMVNVLPMPQTKTPIVRMNGVCPVVRVGKRN